MRSGLCSVPLETPFSPEGYLMREVDGELQVVPGYVRVTAAHLPIPADGAAPTRHAMMAEPGAPVPPEALVVLVWGVEWSLAQIVASSPGLAALVLEREYELPGDPPARGRRKMAEAAPEGATTVAENLVPVLFAGEEGL